MKMVYASATKGTFALHAAVLTTAHKLGLSSEYFDELKYSKPDILSAMERMIPRIPLDAARWEGEMHEIANTFSDAGVTPCLLYTSPSPRDTTASRMPSSA